MLFQEHADKLPAYHGVCAVYVRRGLLHMYVEGVGARHLPEGKAHKLPVGKEDAALQSQLVIMAEGPLDGVVLKDNALIQALGVVLRPGVEHLRTVRDQALGQRHKGPVVLRLEAVAVVFLPMQGLAGIGGQLLGLIDVVGVALLFAEAEAAGKFLLQDLLVPLGNAAQEEGIVLRRRVLPQRLDRRAQRAAADGIDKGGPPVQAHLRQRALTHVAHELAVMLVPDIHVAEVEVGAGGILTHEVAVDPFLVQQGDCVKLDHRYTLSQTALISFLKLRRSINASGRLPTSRRRAEGW